mgnify:CR=1 FL=1
MLIITISRILRTTSKLILFAFCLLPLIGRADDFCPGPKNKEQFFSEEFTRCINILYIRGFSGLSIDEKQFVKHAFAKNLPVYFGPENKFDVTKLAKVALTFDYQTNFNYLMSGIKYESEETLDLVHYLFVRDPISYMNYAEQVPGVLSIVPWAVANEAFYEVSCENSRVYLAGYHAEKINDNEKYSSNLDTLNSQLMELLECDLPLTH